MIMIVLGVLSWPGLARLIRGQILSERECDYVLAARALGIKNKHIIWRHIFPAVTSIVLVNLTLGYAGSLLTEAGLSFLGLAFETESIVKYIDRHDITFSNSIGGVGFQSASLSLP